MFYPEVVYHHIYGVCILCIVGTGGQNKERETDREGGIEIEGTES